MSDAEYFVRRGALVETDAFNGVCEELAQALTERDALTARVAKLEAALREMAAETEEEFVGGGEYDLNAGWVKRPTRHALKARAALTPEAS